MVAITDSDGWVPVTRPEITDIALGGNETNFPGKFFRELASRDKYLYEQALGGDAQSIASAVAFRQLGIAAVAQGRLTLETGVAVSTTDQLAKTVLYYTPYNGDYVALYDTGLSRWDLYQFTERSLSLSGLAANTNYDIFIYDASGTLTLEAVAWSNSGAGTSTRASAISQLEGVWVKDSDKRRLLGTIRTTATIGQCEFSLQKRFVCNLANLVPTTLYKDSSVVNTYTSSTWRYYNNDANNRVEFVLWNSASTTLIFGSHLSGDGSSVDASLNGATIATSEFHRYVNGSTFTNPATLMGSKSQALLVGYHFAAIYQNGLGITGTGEGYFDGAWVSCTLEM